MFPTRIPCCFFFFFNDTATTEIYTLSLHDALPISSRRNRITCEPMSSRSPSTSRWGSSRNTQVPLRLPRSRTTSASCSQRSEEHTSELQSPCNLVCRLLLEKKKKTKAKLSIPRLSS